MSDNAYKQLRAFYRALRNTNNLIFYHATSIISQQITILCEMNNN